MESANNHEVKVATLVFLDLETTGLPHNVGTKNVHITEIALVAVSREEFGGSVGNCRVINKLNLCVQPRTAISLGAMNVSGLDNALLESQAQFDVSTALVLHEFLLRLQQPVCFLAHNGNRYDFPLLQAELLRIGRNLPYQLLCADTLQAFRSFGPSVKDKLEPAYRTSEHPSKNGSKYKTSSSCLTEEVIDQMLSDEIDVFANYQSIPTTFTTQIVNDIQRNPDEQISTCINPFKEFQSVDKVLEQGWITPGVDEMTTPKKCNSFHVLPSLKQNNKTHMPAYYEQNSQPSAKRKLQIGYSPINPNDTKASTHPQSPVCKKGQYSLEKLYINFFGEKPIESHHAENDCITLMKICHQIRTAFLEWLDKNCMLFTDVSPMWKVQ